jgi:UDP-2-acetamido-3-amino-2,3-dideoxy-glucuronate N-acetyltransferase
MEQGVGCVVADDFEHGENFSMGNYCVIQEGCKVGDNVRLEHFVLLKKGTEIGDDVYVDSYVKSSGGNRVGSRVTLRFNATIAREVTVEDDVFISPNVMTIYKDHEGQACPGTVIGKGSHIGTNAVIGPSVKIAPGSVVGALAFVGRDIETPGIYVGIPAKKLRDL